jgi:hypothetical protein
MALLVALTESLKNLLKHGLLGFWDALLAQVDAERTQCRSTKADDVGSGQPHKCSLRNKSAQRQHGQAECPDKSVYRIGLVKHQEGTRLQSFIACVNNNTLQGVRSMYYLHQFHGVPNLPARNLVLGKHHIPEALALPDAECVIRIRRATNLDSPWRKLLSDLLHFCLFIDDQYSHGG